MNVLLNTAYWPNLHYFYYLINCEKAVIEVWDNYHKQSFRNRTQILSANGVLDLTIPVRRGDSIQLTKDVRINYTEKWQLNHWRALTSAYKNSPFFDYFEDEVRVFYTEQFELLTDYNRRQLELIFKLLRLKKTVTFSEQFEKAPQAVVDRRELIHPKRKTFAFEDLGERLRQPYYQTFQAKFGFIENLSILDLIFNKGLDAIVYLRD